MKRNVISALAVAGLLACSLNQNSAYADNVIITDYSELPGAALTSGDTLTLGGNIIVTDNNMQSYLPSGTLTIFGQGNELDGSSTYEGFTIADPSIYTLNDVTVKNFLSNPGNGGAIDNNATLNLTGTTVTGDTNRATTGSGGFLYNTYSTNSLATNLVLTSNTAQTGGAIYNNAGATFAATGDISASDNSATINQGGAIYNAGTANIATATFTSNSSNLEGGAIYNTGGLTATGNVVFGDYTGSVASLGNSTSSGDGGAIYNSGSVNLQGGAEFYDNSANSGTAANGGAIYNTGTLNIGGANLTAIENTAASGNGGFLYNSSATPVNLTSTNITLSGNSALSGGAIYNNSGTVNLTGDLTASGNQATAGDGGFLYAGAGSATSIDNATISSNTATGRGGAIYMEGTAGNAAVVNVDASTSDTTFTNNTAAGGSSDAIYMNSNSTVNIDSAAGTQVAFNDDIIANMLANEININSGNVNFNGDIKVNATSSLEITNAGTTQISTATMTSGTAGNPNTFTINSNAGSVTSTGAVSANNYNEVNLNTTATGTISLDTVAVGTSSAVNLNAAAADSIDITNLNVAGTGNTVDSTGANANIGTVTFSGTSDLTLNTQNLSITTGIVSNGAGTLNKAAAGTLDIGSLTVSTDNSLTVNSNAGDTTFTTANLANATSGNTTLSLNSNAGNIASTGAVAVNNGNILNLANNAAGSTLVLDSVTMGANSQINIASNNAAAGSMDLGSLTVNSTGNTITNTVPANAATVGAITFNNTSDLTLASGGLDITGVTSNGVGTLTKSAAGTQALGTLAVSADNTLNVTSTAGDTTFTTANLTNATAGNTTTLGLSANGSNIASTGAVSLNDNNTLNLTTDATGTISLNEVVLNEASQVRASSGNATAGSLDLGKLTVNSTGNTVYNNVTASDAVLGDITFNNTSSLTLGSGNLQIDNVISNGNATLNKNVVGTQNLGSLTLNTDNSLTINSLVGTTNFTTADLADATSGNTTLSLNSEAGTLTSSGLVSINDGNILNLTNAVSNGSISLNSVSMGADSQININANRTTSGAINLGSLSVNSTNNTITNTVPANSATIGAITFNNTSDLTLNSGGLAVTSVTSNGAGTLNKGIAGTQDLGTVAVIADNSLIINSTAGDTNFTDADIATATAGNNSVLTLNANGGNITSTGTTTVNNGGILNVNQADATSSITFNTLSMTDNTLLDMSNGKTETLNIANFNVLNPTDVAKVRLDIDLTAQTTDFIDVANPMTNAVTLDFNAANILNNPGGRHVYYFNVANSNVNINDYNNPRVGVFSATNGYYISYLNMPPNLYPNDEYTYPENTIRVTTEDVNDGLRDAVTLQGLRYFDITSLDQVHYVGNSAVTSGDGLLNMEVTTNGSYPGGTLTVRGNSLNGTISGAATTPGLTSVSLFKVDSSADDVSRTLNIEGGITIADAVGTDGAAVYLKDGATAGTANLNLNNVAFTSNQSSAQGGAIYNEGTVASTGAVIFGSATDNTKGNTAGTNGGALYNATTATFDASTGFYNNVATAGSGGAVYNNGTLSLGNGTGTDVVANENLATAGNGGFLYNNTGFTTTINADTITLNSNQAQNGGAIFNNGGTLNVTGTLSADANIATTGNGGFLSNDSIVTLGTSQFTSNTANAGLGGGIYNNGGTVTASGLTQFGSYNPATQVTGDGNTATEGGALYNDGAATFNGGLNLFGNSASTGAGGGVNNTNASALTVAGSAFNAINNQAQTVGGAISNTGGSTVDITSSTILFSGNTALSGTAGGGSIYNDNNSVVTLNGTTTTFIGSADGSVVNANQGGGIFNTGAGAVVNIGNTTSTSGFSNLVATNEGGAIYNNLGATNVYGDTVFDANESSLNGGAIYNNAAVIVGSDNTSVHLFENNSAASGGALYNTGTLDVKGSTQFDSNTSTSVGGAVYNTSNLTIGVDGTNVHLFSHNNATEGSVIYNDGGNVSIEGSSQFSNNDSSTGGGAVVNDAGVVHMGSNNTSQIAFVSNNAVNGAAVTNVGGTVELEGDTIFTSNTASAKGGAIYNEQGTLTIGSDSDSTNIFTSNTAQEGGAIYSLNNDLVFNGSTVFTGNTATGNGGAINTNFSDVNLSPYTLFESNSATNGGALFVNGSTANIEEGTLFLNNSASQDGAAIYMTGTASQNAVVNINSDNPSAPIAFANNTSGNGNAIYLDKNSTLNLNTSNSADLILPENIAGGSDNNMINVNATTDAPVVFMGNNSNYAGDFYLNSGDAYFTNGSAFFQGGNYTFAPNTTLHLLNEQIDTISAKSVTFPSSGTSYLTMDADLQTGFNDRFFATNSIRGNLTISDINLMNENNADETYFEVANGANVKPLYEGMQTNGKYYKYGVYSAPYGFRAEKQGLIDTSYQAGQVAQVGALANQYVIYNQLAQRAENASIRKFYERKAKAEQKSSEDTSGVAKVETASPKPETAVVDKAEVKGESPFRRLLAKKNKKQAPNAADEFLKQNQELAKADNIKENVVEEKPVSDVVKVAEKSTEKIAAENPNEIKLNLDESVLPKAPANPSNGVILIDESTLPKLRPDYDQMISAKPTYDSNSGGVWVDSFTTVETISPSGLSGFKNFSYGVILGYDMPTKTLDNGLELQSTLFGGYQGSNQDYDNVKNYQNGGFGGYMLNLYKDNAFATVSLLAGGIGVDAQDNQGKNNQNYGMFVFGLSSKAGYNIALPANLILQPNLTMAYSFLSGHEGENSIGETLKVNALNNLLVTPGVKLIGNYKGWEPYLTAGYAFPLFGKTLANVNNIGMPNVELRPYIEYGAGIRKNLGERFAGFGEAVYRNGGRTGITFQGGFTIKF